MANEERLISLDEALKATHGEIYWTESTQAAVRSFLVKQPTVDAVEVVHGKWKSSDFIPGMLTCTNCGAQRNPKFKIGGGEWHYCPNCCAKMDG